MNKQKRDYPDNTGPDHLVVDGINQQCVGSSVDDESACLCPEKDYLIKDEEDALAELRRIKAQANQAKKHLEDLHKKIDAELLENKEARLNSKEEANYAEQEKLDNELKECEKKIESLRSEWKDWDEKRKEATRKKLILLGHIS